MRMLLLLALAVLGSSSFAQTYKCTDAARRTVYSSERCESQGLKPVGEVADRITVLPAGAAPKPAADSKPPADSKPKPPAAAPVPDKPAK